MTVRDAKAVEPLRKISPQVTVVALVVVQTLAYAAIAVLSPRFAPGTRSVERPILVVLGLFGVAFLCYWIALAVVLKIRESARLAMGIVLASLLFRAVVFVSWPIQEIDIYRYIWDGTVLVQGISPYRYSPQQVLSAALEDDLPRDLHRLKRLELSNPTVHTILSRVHYGELSTIYPPASQAIFAIAVLLTPDRASVFGRISRMKAVFVLLDLATLLVIIALLRAAGKHIGWSVAYGWCPLVIKEIANTGHLDSLAVLLTMLALYLAAGPLFRGGTKRRAAWWVLSSAVVGALAVGAKLYPIVLAPLLAALWARATSWRWALAAILVLVLATAAVLWPMMRWEKAVVSSSTDASAASAGERSFPVPTSTASCEPAPTPGLAAFLRRWEMNDLLFMLVVENLRPSEHVRSSRPAWFAVLPEAWRRNLTAAVSQRLGIDRSEAPFLVARFATTAIFLMITTALLWRAHFAEDQTEWLRTAFLIVAWFWLLSPTQNPWYWIWALPLVMFARSRAWLLVSGLVMLYYLRFWLSYHWPEQTVAGTPYRGAEFFDYVVTWVEYGPCFAWLVRDAIGRRSRTPERMETRDGIRPSPSNAN